MRAGALATLPRRRAAIRATDIGEDPTAPEATSSVPPLCTHLELALRTGTKFRLELAASRWAAYNGESASLQKVHPQAWWGSIQGR